MSKGCVRRVFAILTRQNCIWDKRIRHRPKWEDKNPHPCSLLTSPPPLLSLSPSFLKQPINVFENFPFCSVFFPTTDFHEWAEKENQRCTKMFSLCSARTSIATTERTATRRTREHIPRAVNMCGNSEVLLYKDGATEEKNQNRPEIWTRCKYAIWKFLCIRRLYQKGDAHATALERGACVFFFFFNLV